MGVRLLHRLHSKQADVRGEGAEVSRGILRSFRVRFRVKGLGVRVQETDGSTRG